MPRTAVAGSAGTSAAGNRIKNRVPVGKLSSTRIVPLCSAMIRLAIANPSPVPRSFVEKCGKNSRSLSSGEIPCPLSEISISTASPSLSTRVATRSCRIVEPSIASAALSIRFASTRRNNSAIRLHRRQRCRELRPHRNAFQPSVKQIQRAGHNRIHVRGSKPRGREARELREFVHQRFQRMHLALDQSRAFRHQFFKLRARRAGLSADCCVPDNAAASAPKAESASADS